MAQTDTQIFLAIIIFLALGGFILFWFLDKQCDRCRDKRMTQGQQNWKSNRDNPRGDPMSVQEKFSEKPPLPDHYPGPTRMDSIYESQDYYKSHPFIYPTPNSFVTSSFAIKRALKERQSMHIFE